MAEAPLPARLVAAAAAASLPVSASTLTMAPIVTPMAAAFVAAVLPGSRGRFTARGFRVAHRLTGNDPPRVVFHHRDVLAHQALNVAKVVALLVVAEGDGRAVGAGAPRAR